MKILQTTNYDQFRACENNRAVRRNPRLVQSMERYGFLSAYPIHVKKNGSGYIILDGQHRFDSAQELGLPVKYVIENNSDISIPEINNAQKKWSGSDYISSYAQQGNSHYIYLKDFIDRHKLGVSISVQLLGQNSVHDGGGPVMSAFKEGEFKVLNQELAERMATMVGYAQKYIPFARTRNFIGALHRCARVDGWDDDRFIKKLSTHGALVERRATISDFIIEIENLYNRSARNNDRLPIAVYAKQL